MIKKLKLILVLLLMIIGLSGCAAKPEATVKSYLEELKTNITSDFKTIAIQDYFDGNVNFGVANNINQDDSVEYVENDFTRRYQELFQGFEYEVIDSKVNDKVAIVNVDIKTYPIAELLSKYFTELLTNIFNWSLSGMTQDEIDQQSQKIFIDLAENIQKNYTQSVSVKLNKVEGKWLIAGGNENDQLFNALTGGTIEYFKNISE